MIKIRWIIGAVFLIWLTASSDGQALLKGLKGSFVDDVVENTKKNTRRELEEKARLREEARAREIDKSLEEMGI